MPTFEYQATKSTGESTRGLQFGATLDQVLKDLADKGLNVTQIGVAAASGFPADPLATEPVLTAAPTEVRAEGPFEIPTPSTVTEKDAFSERSYAATSVWGPLVGQVPLKNLVFFFRQGGTMLHAGVPMVQAFNTLANQSKNPKLQGILREVSGHIEAGRPISFGLQRYPEVFNGVIISMLRAGEKGGFLDQAMSDIADYLERELEIRNLYKRLTFYPKIQVWASIVIVLAANAIIASVNASAGQLSSPLTTPSTWIWLGPLIILILLFRKVGLANPQIRYQWDQFTTKLPVFGQTMQELAMARFGRAFGAMTKSGVPLSAAMKISADACGNEYLRSLMYPAVDRLETGAGITETLKDTRAFSPIVLDMIATGETTGNLDLMLNKMSEFYEQEATTKSTQLAYLVGVVLGLCVAIYIGYIVINFYTGYFSGLQRAAN
jgi:type IV pilus assembly protein PilC/MSHA biogenesis protein MshG